MKKFLAIAAATAAASFMGASANAAVFFFAGEPSGVIDDAPTNVGNVQNCNSTNVSGSDICTINDALGFDYAEGGFSFNVTARYQSDPSVGDDGTPIELIQDLISRNQGLGAISTALSGENRRTQDQINFQTQESLFFDFGAQVVSLSDIFLNSGTGNDCPAMGSPEGPCGTVGISIDGGLVQQFAVFLANGLLDTGVLVGTTFEFFALGDGSDDFFGGYSIEQFTVTPVPAALPLLLSGLAGLGFASRRRKNA